MLKEFTKGVNTKKFWITAVVIFFYISITDFIIHEVILKSAYQATMSLWRPMDEMNKMMGWMMLAHALFAIVFTFIFTKGNEGKGWKEGARFGFLIGLLGITNVIMQYFSTPIPCELACKWMIFGMVQMIIGGAVTAAVYKK